MPDDHSKVVPLLPIPNRTVKRLSANDSADSRVKVGHRQAITAANAQSVMTGRFALGGVNPSCDARVQCFNCDRLRIDCVLASRSTTQVVLVLVVSSRGEHPRAL